MNDITIALKAVIGTVICEPTLLEELKANLRVEYIYNLELKEIFKTICRLEELGHSLDRVSIISNIHNCTPVMEQLTSECIGLSNVLKFDFYIQIIKDKITLGEIEKMLTTHREKLSMGAFDTPDSLISSISGECEKILENCTKKETITEYKDLIPEVASKIMEQAKTGVQDFGYKTGYEDLDKMINGLVPADLVIIAARPSMGKTTFGFNVMENIAREEDGHCLMFSLEMKKTDLAVRSISRFIGESQTNLKKADFTDMSMANFKSKYKDISNLKIKIDESSSLNVTELRMRATREHKKNKLKMIMVDYLQIMNVKDTNISEENRSLALAHITGSLKRLAKDLQVPVVALSQLNRNLEQRVDKRPVNSDLKESSAIEQDADVILFLYRDEIYNEDTQDKGIAEIIIGKQRAGELGTVKTRFNGQYSRFENLHSDETNEPSQSEIFTPPAVGYVPDISAEEYSYNDFGPDISTM